MIFLFPKCRHFFTASPRCLYRARGKRAQLVQISAFRRLQSLVDRWFVASVGVFWGVLSVCQVVVGQLVRSLMWSFFGIIALNDVANETSNVWIWLNICFHIGLGMLGRNGVLGVHIYFLSSICRFLRWCLCRGTIKDHQTYTYKCKTTASIPRGTMTVYAWPKNPTTSI